MLKHLGLIGLAILGLTTVGCSIDSSLYGIKPVAETVVRKGVSQGIVSGSTQKTYSTTNHYYVSV